MALDDNMKIDHIPKDMGQVEADFGTEIIQSTDLVQSGFELGQGMEVVQEGTQLVQQATEMQEDTGEQLSMVLATDVISEHAVGTDGATFMQVSSFFS